MLKFGNIVLTNNSNWLNIPEHNVITSGNHGTVTASPSKGIQGTEVTLSNIPDTGYEFSSYSVTGATLKNDNQFDIGITDVNVNGNFTGIVRSVTTTSSPVAGGSVTALPNSGIIGTEVTLSNTPAEGYNFNGYVISGATLSGDTFTIGESDVSVTGKFMVANGYYNGTANVEYYGNLSGNTVSGIPIYGNFNYYVPVKANLSGPYSSTGTLSYTISSQRAFVFMNDNGADGITSLSLKFNESSGLVIGDNTLNNLTSVSFSLGNHNPLYIGNNSMNLTNTTQVNLELSNMDQIPVYIGDGSCNNFNLSMSGNTGPIKVGNNSLRTLTLKQDSRYYFSSGNFGAHLDVTPLIINYQDRVELYGDIKSMIQASMNTRSSSVKVIDFSNSGNTSIRCPDCSSSDISWLNSNKSSFMNDPYGRARFSN